MDKLELMYKVIESMSTLKYPIVFKGALVLNHLMETKGITETQRGTKDIDADWVGGRVSMEELLSIIKESIDCIEIDGLEVRLIREATERRSSGFEVLLENQNLFSFDISLRKNQFTTEYITRNGVTFIGASKEKIFIDKISAISSRILYRRTKDIYDLYLLSMLEGYYIGEINYVLEHSGRRLSEFNEFINDIGEIKNAYFKMRGIINPPEFDIMYGRVRDFCSPYITKGYTSGNGLWNVKAGLWIPVQ